MKEETLKDLAEHPFEPWTLRLRRPLKQGELEVAELVLKPPTVKDILRGDGRSTDTVSYVIAVASSLSGVPEIAFHSMVPEDYADLRLVISLVNSRFVGEINLLDKKKEESEEDPTKAADTPPLTSARTSAE
ncbi:MAG: phage tail assembly protein [Treponematales bacterium]